MNCRYRPAGSARESAPMRLAAESPFHMPACMRSTPVCLPSAGSAWVDPWTRVAAGPTRRVEPGMGADDAGRRTEPTACSGLAHRGVASDSTLITLPARENGGAMDHEVVGKKRFGAGLEAKWWPQAAGVKAALCRALLALASAMPGVVHAQLTPDQIDQANRDLDRIQQEQRQRLEYEREQQRANRPRTTVETPAPPDVAPDRGGPCRDIRDVQIDGASSLEAEVRARLAAPYVGTCMNVTDVERLLNAITTHYFKRGFIGARAYIQTQDLKDGVLRVLVIEGKVSELRLEDGERSSVNLFTAFPGVLGAPLNLRDFEQGLDQINRLSSNRATLNVEPGEQPGDTVVVIRNQPGRVLHTSVTYDNFGSDPTGRDQLGVNLMLDNPAQINDSLMATHRHSVSSGYSERHSYTTSLLYSVPLGYLTATASQVFNQYVTAVELPTLSLESSGKSTTTALQLSYVAYRDQVNSLWLESTVTVKENNNFLEGQKLRVSSRRLTNLDLRASWNTRVWDGPLSVGLDYVRGLTWFGGYNDPAGLPSDAPRAQYDKWETLISWNKPFELGGRGLMFSSRLSGQWSGDVMYGQDQFLVGSIFSVRGFRDTSVSGDRGYYWRNEVTLPFSVQVRDFPIGLRPMVGLDTGTVDAHAGQRGGSLTGAAVGIGVYLWKVVADVKCVMPISKPDRFEDEGTQWYFNFSSSI